MNEYKIRKKCAICDNKKLTTIVDYGNVPLAGFFPKKEELNDIKRYNLSLQYCNNCHLLQTNSVIDANILFKDYRYMSSVSLQKHFNEYAKYLYDKFNLNKKSKVLEFGSNDGVLLKPLMDLGVPVKGIDPSLNISKLAIEKGCDVIIDFFNVDTARKLYKKNSLDLVTSSNTFAHIDDIHSVVEGLHYCLKENGHFIFEVHYGKNIIEELQYDNVYHEHIYYYTIHALNILFKKHNMQIVNVDEIPLHSGSIRVIVINKPLLDKDINGNLLDMIKKEKNIGITNMNYYDNYNNSVNLHKTELLDLLKNIKSQNKKIGAYGASGRANILCNFLGIDNTLIDYIIDESPERNGRFINNIPILDKEYIDPNSDYIIIFAWNYSKMIISKLVDKYDYKYIIPFPDICIVDSNEDIDKNNTL